MNTILKRNYINSLKAEESQLCNCNCDLQVLKEIIKEKENKIDELDKKFMPYIFENRVKVLHCKDCDTIYLMKSKYEASSKIDFEEIECILKKDYFKAKEYINRLEKRYITEDTHIICIDEYIIKFIKYINNEKFSSRIISFENTEVDYNYISNKKICYNCENKRIIEDNLIKCFKHNGTYEKSYTCNDFNSIYEEE